MIARPVAPTVNELARRRYHLLKGGSGRQYVCGVFAPNEQPYFENVAVVVAANNRGQRTVLDVSATGDLPQLYFDRQSYKHALECGANEVHVHFADAADEARCIANDMAAEHLTGRRFGIPGSENMEMAA